jgi:hypothetical protein
MTRIVVILSVFLAAACDVGEIPLNGNGTDGGGGQGDGGGGSGDAAGNGCAAAVTPAPGIHPHAAQGNSSNQGLNCMAAGACHGVGGAGPTFTFAGTVFAATAGAAPNAGAQVRVKFGAMTLQAITDADGNFYSTQAVTYPATTNATKCPTVTAMVTPLGTGNGQCNTCHNRNGGSTAQIVLQ